MKLISVFFSILLLLSSCQTKKEQSKQQKLLLEQYDELNIIYFSKDTFVFKTIDTSTIKTFAELITLDNEDFADTCEITEQLTFKSKGQPIFSAQVSIENIKDSISCNNVTYFLDSKIYRHRLTYHTGMGIDEIYWHKVNPQSNPWSGVDTTKFHYDDIKNNR